MTAPVSTPEDLRRVVDAIMGGFAQVPDDGWERPAHQLDWDCRDTAAHLMDDFTFYALTPDGRPVPSPGFVRFGADGLGKPGEGKRWLRFDVARQWELVKALLEAPDSHVQWIFCARWLEALIIEHALAKGEDPELVWHAEIVLKQPGDRPVHRLHLRAVGQRVVQRVAQPAAAHAGGAGIEQRQQRGRWLAADGLADFEIAPRRRIHAQEAALGLDVQRADMRNRRALG